MLRQRSRVACACARALDLVAADAPGAASTSGRLFSAAAWPAGGVHQGSAGLAGLSDSWARSRWQPAARGFSSSGVGDGGVPANYLSYTGSAPDPGFAADSPELPGALGALLQGMLAGMHAPAHAPGCTLCTRGAGGMTGFDPVDVVAAAGTAEADAVAAAYDYTWLPGKGMMQVLTSLHDFTGLPWCAHGARRVARLHLCASLRGRPSLEQGRLCGAAQVGIHRRHGGAGPVHNLPVPGLGYEEYAQAGGARRARSALPPPGLAPLTRRPGADARLRAQAAKPEVQKCADWFQESKQARSPARQRDLRPPDPAARPAPAPPRARAARSRSPAAAGPGSDPAAHCKQAARQPRAALTSRARGVAAAARRRHAGADVRVLRPRARRVQEARLQPGAGAAAHHAAGARLHRRVHCAQRAGDAQGAC